MLRIPDIQQGLAHLVGWEQVEGTARRINDGLTQSESGLYYQQAHDLLTLDNIRAILPPEPAAYPTWDSTKEYLPGDIVLFEGDNYICRKKNVDERPGYDYNDDYNEDFFTVNAQTYWDLYDQLSEFLKKATLDGIAKMVNRVVEEKTIAGASKQLFEQKTLFDVAGRIDNRISTSHSLVGYEIEPLRGLGVTTQLHRIGLQMTGGTGNVTIYIFHSSRKTPVATFNLRVIDGKGYQWYRQDNLFLPYHGSDTRNDGGAWYICYNQDDMPEGMQAVNIGRDWSTEPCGSCNNGDVNAWRTMTRYIRISPFRVAVPDNFADNPQFPDLATVDFTPNSCYGMNLDLSIGCDLSDFFIGQRSIFANVLMKEVSVNLLRRILHNPSVNVNRNQMNAALQMDIEGSTMMKSSGLVGELNRAYKAIDLDTQGLDSACLACKKNGVRIGLC